MRTFALSTRLEAARALPGVLQILLGRDLPAYGVLPPERNRDETALAVGQRAVISGEPCRRGSVG